MHLDLSHLLCFGSVCYFVPHSPLDVCLLFKLHPSMSFLLTLSGAWTERRDSASVGKEVGTWRAGQTNLEKVLFMGHFLLSVLI